MPSARVRTCCIAAALVWLQATSSVAQQQKELTDYTVATWTDKDGLPAGRVRALAQDQAGYLWLGTDSGILRFDGNRFVTWGALGLPLTPHTIVSTLLSARDGSLWIGFEYGGVIRLQNGEVQMWKAPDDVGVSYTASLMEDHEGAIWLTSREGLHRFFGGRWENFFGRHGLPANKEVMAVFEDSRDDVWVAVRDSVFRRRRGETQFQQVDTLEDATLLYQRFSEDASGVVWRTDLRQGTRALGLASQPASPVRGLGTQVLHDRAGNVWVGTRGEGLWYVPARDARREGAVKALPPAYSVPSEHVHAMIEDREGNIWVGSASGLQRYSRRKVTTITEFGAPGTVAGTADGSMWIATARGLVRFIRGEKRFYGESEGLPSPRVLGLNIGGDDLWAITAKGLAKFERDRFVPVEIPAISSLVRLGTMATQAETSWFHDAQQGLFRVRGGTLQQLSELPNAFSHRLSDMRVDARGNLWVSSIDGVLSVVDRDQRVRLYSLPIGDVATIYDDHDGAVWVGGRYGLSRVREASVMTVNSQNGLPDDITTIVEDNSGVLWVGCGSGILRLEKSEFDKAAADRNYQLRFQVFDTSDGTAGSPLSGRSKSARATDGRLWFATSAGLTIVDPSDPGVTPTSSPAPPVVESLAANGQIQIVHPGLRLSSGTTHLQFDYTALNLTHPLRMRFRYRLDGVDADWVNAGTIHRATYTNVSGGAYRFRLMATDGSGDWVESTTPLTFAIAPRFYRTSAFYVLAFAVTTLAGWGVWQLRVRQMRSQFAQVLAERVRLSRAIHDTLLQGLAALALHVDHLAETLPQQNRQAFVALRQRIEAYVREARRSIWELRSPALLDHDFVTALKSTTERIFAATPVTTDLVVEGTPRECSSKVEEHLLSIAHEAMSNTFRHADATHVQLRLDYEPHEVRLTILDNGRGFDLQTSHVENHYGLMTMQEHADEARGVLQITTSPGQGTRISVAVALREAA